VFDVQAKDGYSGFYSFHNRYSICKVANLGHLLSSGPGDIMKRYILRKEENYQVPTISRVFDITNQIFFGWKINNSCEIETLSGAVHCKIYEASKACKDLRIGFNYNADRN
jgi:hypothetical protein